MRRSDQSGQGTLANVPDNECDRLIEAIRGVGLRLNLKTDDVRVGLRAAANA